MSVRFTNWHEARAYAQERASRSGLDVALRACREFGKLVFNVFFAAWNDSDYALAEIVEPRKAAA